MISIIGAGRVGSSIAFLCASSGIDDIVLVNRGEKKAVGEALDICNAIPSGSPISILGTSDYSKISGSDIIVIAASAGAHMQKRTEMMREQAEMITHITSQVSKHASGAKVLIVTNPVDVLTYVAQKKARLDPKKVIGVASSLDSSRLRYLLARELNVVQSEISGVLVMGEHDDSMVPIFSAARCKSKPVTDLLDQARLQRITADLRNYWKLLRAYKGSSVFGIAKNTFDIINAISNDSPLDTAASVLLGGQYGVSDLCMGVPVTLAKSGVLEIRQIPLSHDEATMVSESAARVKSNIDSLEQK